MDDVPASATLSRSNGVLIFDGGPVYVSSVLDGLMVWTWCSLCAEGLLKEVGLSVSD